ncbi:unnamed protein product [Auanema sp. JU1783]|nr:unnamed protein product [Auanema sp. JU1783]
MKRKPLKSCTSVLSCSGILKGFGELAIHPHRSIRNESTVSHKEFEFTKHLENLQPTEHWFKNLDAKKREQYDLLQKELEIYVYLATIMPQKLSDKDWNQLLTLKDVKSRVGLLAFVALKQIREEKDQRKKESKDNDYQSHLVCETEKFLRGEMGYGVGLNQLLINPLRNRKKLNHIRGSRVLRSLTMEAPELLLDLQNIPNELQRNQRTLARHVQYLISENYDNSVPLPLRFINYKDDEYHRNFVFKEIGFFNGDYLDQNILPQVSELGVQNQEKEVIYISRHARSVLDGPLKHDAYVIPITMDASREALGNGRRAKVHTMRLPIQRYVKWQNGPMVISCNNIARILRDVYVSGGDWKYAFLKNISKRHFMSVEERESTMWNTNKYKERMREQRDLIQAIRDATGHL